MRKYGIIFTLLFLFTGVFLCHAFVVHESIRHRNIVIQELRIFLQPKSWSGLKIISIKESFL